MQAAEVKIRKKIGKTWGCPEMTRLPPHTDRTHDDTHKKRGREGEWRQQQTKNFEQMRREGERKEEKNRFSTEL